jgi:hypothetical protein
LETEHAFDNDDLLGLPNLGEGKIYFLKHFDIYIDIFNFSDKELANCSDDPNEEVRLIEERMRELHAIYHKNKNELADLEREHRKTVANRRSWPIFLLNFT